MAKEQAASSDAEPSDAAPTDLTPEVQEGADPQERFEQLQSAAAESYEKLSEAATQLTDQARSIYLTRQDSVRRNPVGYALGAFALGCILGVLFGRD